MNDVAGFQPGRAVCRPVSPLHRTELHRPRLPL